MFVRIKGVFRKNIFSGELFFPKKRGSSGFSLAVYGHLQAIVRKVRGEGGGRGGRVGCLYGFESVFWKSFFSEELFFSRSESHQVFPFGSLQEPTFRSIVRKVRGWGQIKLPRSNERIHTRVQWASLTYSMSNKLFTERQTSQTCSKSDSMLKE